MFTDCFYRQGILGHTIKQRQIFNSNRAKRILTWTIFFRAWSFFMSVCTVFSCSFLTVWNWLPSILWVWVYWSSVALSTIFLVLCLKIIWKHTMWPKKFRIGASHLKKHFANCDSSTKHRKTWNVVAINITTAFSCQF